MSTSELKNDKGTAYDYPDQLPVKMGESVVVDKKPQPAQTAQQSGSPSQKC